MQNKQFYKELDSKKLLKQNNSHKKDVKKQQGIRKDTIKNEENILYKKQLGMNCLQAIKS